TAEGVDPRGKVVGISADDAHAATQFLGSDGAYRFENLRPGLYQVRDCDPGGLGRYQRGLYGAADSDKPIVFDVEVRAGEVAHFDLDQRDRVPARLLGELRFDGAAPVGWRCYVPDADGTGRVETNGSFDLRVPRAGESRLSLSGFAGPARAQLQQ